MVTGEKICHPKMVISRSVYAKVEGVLLSDRATAAATSCDFEQSYDVFLPDISPAQSLVDERDLLYFMT